MNQHHRRIPSRGSSDLSPSNMISNITQNTQRYTVPAPTEATISKKLQELQNLKARHAQFVRSSPDSYLEIQGLRELIMALEESIRADSISILIKQNALELEELHSQRDQDLSTLETLHNKYRETTLDSWNKEQLKLREAHSSKKSAVQAQLQTRIPDEAVSPAEQSQQYRLLELKEKECLRKQDLIQAEKYKNLKRKELEVTNRKWRSQKEKQIQLMLREVEAEAAKANAKRMQEVEKNLEKAEKEYLKERSKIQMSYSKLENDLKYKHRLEIQRVQKNRYNL